jgi:hypothetical protein
MPFVLLRGVLLHLVEVNKYCMSSSMSSYLQLRTTAYMEADHLVFLFIILLIPPDLLHPLGG